jgi:1-acyl-sn-glycerol-3-phosphate acyltransferase
MAKFIVAIQVGPIEVRGSEILKDIASQRPREPDSAPRLGESPAIFVCNHTHYADPAVVPLIINRSARYMPAVGVMHFAWGMGAHFISKPMAAIPVQILPGQGGPAREAAVEALTRGDTIVIFPEGWAYQDGKPYKKGAAQIALEATKLLNKPIPIIPMFVRYTRYPGRWVSKLGPPWEYFCVLFAAWYYRRGAVAVIGTPILSTELPADVGAATDLIRRRVLELDPGKV